MYNSGKFDKRDNAVGQKDIWVQIAKSVKNPKYNLFKWK